jgi:predicted metal-dependent TIM-barrel fold hydrolase
MSFPNPGVKATLDEIMMSEGAPVRPLNLRQDEKELVRIIELASRMKLTLKSSQSRLTSHALTLSRASALAHELSPDTSYIKAVREVTDRELTLS